MKFSSISKVASVSAIAASFALMSLTLPASAQTSTGTDSDTSTTGTRQDTYSQTTENNNDWGWLGLLGLAGLAGLLPKKEEHTRYRDPNEVTSASGSRR